MHLSPVRLFKCASTPESLSLLHFDSTHQSAFPSSQTPIKTKTKTNQEKLQLINLGMLNHSATVDQLLGHCFPTDSLCECFGFQRTGMIFVCFFVSPTFFLFPPFLSKLLHFQKRDSVLAYNHYLVDCWPKIMEECKHKVNFGKYFMKILHCWKMFRIQPCLRLRPTSPLPIPQHLI